MKFSDKRRSHAYMIGLEPSKRTWNGERIAHAHILFFVPHGTYDVQSMSQYLESIGLRFKSRYWVPTAARSYVFIDLDFFSILLIILYLLKCGRAHKRKLTTREWSIDLYLAQVPCTQFFPVWIQIDEQHVIREFLYEENPEICGAPYRRLYRKLAPSFSMSQSYSEEDDNGASKNEAPSGDQVEVIDCDEDEIDDGEDDWDENILELEEETRSELFSNVVGLSYAANVVEGNSDDNDDDL